MNVFCNPDIAESYDTYYETDFGKKVDLIEQNIVSNLIKDIPRDQMIELGCGTGHWSEFFIAQGFKLIGIDESEAMLRIANKKNITAEFLKADTHNLPFNDESFNVVSTITMLEFVDNQDEVLKEINRILIPGGWLILGGLNADSVLGNSEIRDETFKNAKFLSVEFINNKLKIFGTPIIKKGVYLNANFDILDDTQEIKYTEPTFLAAIVQKNK